MSWAEAAYVVSQLKTGGGAGVENRIKVKTVEANNSYDQNANNPVPTEIDCTEIEGYGNLRLDNFAVIPVKMTGRLTDTSSGGGELFRSITPRAEYNPATGILRLYDYSYGSQHNYLDLWVKAITVSITYDVYCFK